MKGRSALQDMVPYCTNQRARHLDEFARADAAEHMQKPPLNAAPHGIRRPLRGNRNCPTAESTTPKPAASKDAPAKPVSSGKRSHRRDKIVFRGSA
jgi:hypothetical protein